MRKIGGGGLEGEFVQSEKETRDVSSNIQEIKEVCQTKMKTGPLALALPVES